VTLPELVLQNSFGRIAWGIVIAALIAGMLPASRQLSRRGAMLLLGMSIVLTLLPGMLSPAYWLALAFQWPSGMLVGLCLVALARPRLPAGANAGIPVPLACAVVLLGALLYADTLGLVSLGLYHWGFGPRGAPLFALAAMAVAVTGIIHGHARPYFFAALGALSLYTLLRLPTGNLWDALLDPLLWIWALQSLAAKAWRKRERNPSTNKIKQGVGQW
jgi:hypothetical protein